MVDATSATSTDGAGVTVAGAHPWWRRAMVWRSPADQPPWARPVLLAITVIAAVAYGWHMGSSIEIYYAAAVRSMSMSWHDFVYGAFDPAGTVSVDKLPGALWVQALSVRLFGAHSWAVDLPQVLEGALTVLVLYRAVRRLAGARAGIVAAAVLALSPAVVSLDRGNISDTLLVLLLVLAADCVVAAVVSGRPRSMVMAGVWVGLAFQAKMIEAWLVVPALALTYLVASGTAFRSRLLRLGTMVVIVVGVSFSWMAFVSLQPTSHRPYVDGSQHDSVFEQVFDYNGLGRVGQPSPNQQLGRTLDLPFFTAGGPKPAWNRLLTAAYGRDGGWLLPTSAFIVVAGLVARRRRPRTDRLRAGIVLWGAWLLVLGVVFSASGTINGYYLAALGPPVAGLIGIGSTLAWDGRRTAGARIAVIGAVLLSAGYAAWLLPGAGTGLPGWLRPAVLGLGIAAAGVVAVGRLLAERVLLSAVTAGAVLGATVLVPAVAAASLVLNTLGPFDTPFQSVQTTAFTRSFFSAPMKVLSVLPRLEAVRNGAPDLMATQTSVLAATFIFATGLEVLPIGGFTGDAPAPTVHTLAAMVDRGDFHLVLTAATSTDPRVVWVTRHCLKATSPPSTPGSGVLVPVGVHFCLPPR